MEEHLSLAEAAERMGISERTARRWIKSGKLRASKPGRDYWIPESALAELVEESEVRPKAPRRSPSEPSFNDVLEDERRRSRFAEAIIAAAERWSEAMSSTHMADAKRSGLIDAALDLGDVISERAEEEDWEALPNQERLEIVTTMEKLNEAANLGIAHLEESGESKDNEEEARRRRAQIKEMTRRISA